MDAFDFVDIEEEENKENKKKKRANLVKSLPKPKVNFLSMIWNLGTLYFLLSTICVAGFAIAIYISPNSGVNPWPPKTPTPPTPIYLPTVTPTEFTGPPPTPTYLPTEGPSPTEDLAPTETLAFLPTPTDVVFGTPTPTVLSESDYPYQLQLGNPIQLASTIYHPSLACNFLGVGGQAIDKNAAPVLGFAVHVTGTVNGEMIEFLTFTGAASQYGPGGYEQIIADAPLDSTEKLQVQLVDQQGIPLSPVIVFDTFDDCSKNVILINFIEVP